MKGYINYVKLTNGKAVTEHASTDRQCEYLNGYVTVQHRSFGKPSFFDHRNLRLDPRISKLEALELQDARIETEDSKRCCLM